MINKTRMKLTIAFILFVGLFVFYSSSADLKSSQLQIQKRNIFIRSRRSQQLSNLLRIPAIICYYAKYGRWPEYNQNLRQLVFRFSRIVFSMSDESVRLYCNQVEQFHQFFRPSIGPRETPSVFNAINPTPRSLIPSLPPTFNFSPLQTSTTFRPIKSTVRITFPGITTTSTKPASTTSTTTALPTAGSGSASGTGTATGSASGTGTGSASGTAAVGAGTSSRLVELPKAHVSRSIRATSGDVIIPFPKRMSLRRIQF